MENLLCSYLITVRLEEQSRAVVERLRRSSYEQKVTSLYMFNVVYTARPAIPYFTKFSRPNGFTKLFFFSREN